LLALPAEIALSRLNVCGRYRDQWIVIAETREMSLTALSISVSTNAIEWHSRWSGRFTSEISPTFATTANELPPFVPHHGYDEHGKAILAVLDVEHGRWRALEPSPIRFADETSLSKQGCWLIASSWELVTIAGDTGALTARRTHDMSVWAFGERQTWLAQSSDAWAILDPCTLKVRAAGLTTRASGR
jgi:hypothetical protein